MVSLTSDHGTDQIIKTFLQAYLQTLTMLFIRFNLIYCLIFLLTLKFLKPLKILTFSYQRTSDSKILRTFILHIHFFPILSLWSKSFRKIGFRLVFLTLS